jgi:hypothetical protein
MGSWTSIQLKLGDISFEDEFDEVYEKEFF